MLDFTKVKEREWYKEMKKRVDELLISYDYDTDTVAQVVENSPYIGAYEVSNILYEMVKDFSPQELINNAIEYGYYEQVEDDEILVNACFMRVAESVMEEYE